MVNFNIEDFITDEHRTQIQAKIANAIDLISEEELEKVIFKSVASELENMSWLFEELDLSEVEAKLHQKITNILLKSFK